MPYSDPKPKIVSPRSVRWDLMAACRGLDPEMFFDTDSEAEAIKICSRCPVRKECLAEALLNREIGVWGGTTVNDRRRMQLQQQGRAGGREEHPVTDSAKTAD